MRIIEQLVYKITGDTTSFDKSVSSSQTSVSKFSKIATTALTALSVGAIAATAKKMFQLAEQAATTLDTIDKMSQKIGISTQAYQEWDFILSQSGASVNGLQASMKTLSNAASEASDGTAQYADEFKRLGVEVTNTDGTLKDTETLFNEVFAALSDMDDQTQRTATAAALLGRSATELAPALNSSSEEIEAMREQAHDLGLVLGDEAVKAGVALTDSLDQLRRKFTAIKTNAMLPFVNTLNNVIEKILNQKTAAEELITSTNNLASATDDYKTITSQLINPIDNLTEAEKTLLEIQQKRAELKLNQAIIELGKNYADTQRKISNLKNDEEKYQNTIDESLAIINSYTDAQKEELKNYQHTGRAVTQQLIDKGKLLTAEENLERAQLNLLSTQGKLIDENGNFNASITQIAQGVIDQQIELSTLANINADFAESVRVQVEALQARDIALAAAKKAFEDMKNGSDASLISMIQAIEVQEKNVYSTELLRLATEELAKRTEEKAIADAKATEEEKKLQEERQKAADEAIEMFNAEAKARSEAYDKMAETRMSDKEKAFKAIQEEADAYLKAGVARADVAKWVSEQIQKYQDEQTKKAQEEADKQKAIEEDKTKKEQEELDKRNQTNLEALNERLKAEADAYEELEAYYRTDKEAFISNIQKQADEWLKAGVDKVEVAKWVSDQLEEYNQKELEATTDWANVTNQALASIGSTWGYLNDIQKNAHEEELARMEKDGATEEELNAKKNEFAKEESERQKKLASFQALIGSAQAITQVWTDPTLPTLAKIGLSGLAGGSVLAQLSAINSQPVPSYDVGTMNVPQDMAAQIHAGEIIIPAGIAEEARTSGISIEPNSSSSSTSSTLNIGVYLDSKEIAKTTVEKINLGQAGTINVRVVK